MGQQSNKVQKRRRRLDYHKRQKLATKTSAATAKAAVSAKATSAPAKKAAAKSVVAEKAEAAATVPTGA
jgi:hypothetical protein